MALALSQRKQLSYRACPSQMPLLPLLPRFESHLKTELSELYN